MIENPTNRLRPDVETANGCAWPVAIVAVVLIVALFASDWVPGWFEDRDDARLDDLRETTVSACARTTERAEALQDCVKATLAATGQPT